MPQFDSAFFYSQIFWAVIFFGFLYFAVSFFINPAAEKIKRGREDFLENALAQASQDSDKARDLASAYQKALEEVENEAKKIKEGVFTQVTLEFEKKKAQFREKIEKRKQEAFKEIISSFKLSDKEKRTFCLALASEMVEKITGKKAEETSLEELYGKIR